MARFGVINPVVADEHGQIVAGHARVEAARLLGLKQIPVIRLSHLSETEIRAYMLADNKLAEKAGWNREILAIELEELQVALPEIDVDVGITASSRVRSTRSCWILQTIEPIRRTKSPI